jgi:hypothetical protein
MRKGVMLMKRIKAAFLVICTLLPISAIALRAHIAMTGVSAETESHSSGSEKPKKD